MKSKIQIVSIFGTLLFENEIAPLFKNHPDNVVIPEEFDK